MIKAANQPVSIDYVAHHLELSWSTARALLLNLALEGRIKATKTTKSFIFSLNPIQAKNGNQAFILQGEHKNE